MQEMNEADFKKVTSEFHDSHSATYALIEKKLTINTQPQGILELAEYTFSFYGSR